MEGNEELFETYVVCRAVGCLPRGGGLDDQHPGIRLAFFWLAETERRCLESKGDTAMQQFAMRLTGRK